MTTRDPIEIMCEAYNSERDRYNWKCSKDGDVVITRLNDADDIVPEINLGPKDCLTSCIVDQFIEKISGEAAMRAAVRALAEAEPTEKMFSAGHYADLEVHEECRAYILAAAAEGKDE